MICTLLGVGVVGLITFAVHKFTTNREQYYKDRNLKYSGLWSTLKTLINLIFRRIAITELAQELYDKYPDEAIYGSFDFTKKTYVVRDPKVYKRIAIKDFDHFQDRRSSSDGSVDEISSKILIAMSGAEWRQMRATLSPVFTGSKMRQMFELVSECADEIVEHFTKKAESGEKLDVEMKDFFQRYTNDVIATCAFGIKVNSFADPDNEFFVNGQRVLQPPSFSRILRFFLIMWTPKIAKLLKLKRIDESVTMLFKRSILEMMKTRQEKNIYRPDMIQLLMQVREGDLNHQAEEKAKDASDGFAAVEESEVGKTKVTRTGSRFALMEIKAILYYLLLNFSFEPNKDTQIPVKIKKGMMFVTENGVHVELRPRKIQK